jgi:hypothetical protein
MQMRRQLLDKCSFPKHARLYDFIEFSNHALSCPLDFMSCSVVSEVMPHSATSRAGGGDSTMVDWNSGVNTTSTQQCGCTQMTCSKHQQPLESARQLQRGRPAPQFCPGLQPPSQRAPLQHTTLALADALQRRKHRHTVEHRELRRAQAQQLNRVRDKEDRQPCIGKCVERLLHSQSACLRFGLFCAVKTFTADII